MNFQDVKARFPVGTMILYHSTHKNKFYAVELIVSWCDETEQAEVLEGRGRIMTFSFEIIHKGSLWPNTQIVLPPSTSEE